MTALAQGSAGMALVMGFALLLTRQASAAAIMLSIQAAAVAVTAMVAHRAEMAIAPATMIAGVWAAAWFMRRPLDRPLVTAAGGTKLSIIFGAVVAVLCQSLGILGMPLAVVLLSVLLAASRPLPVMQLMALAMMQNGIALAGCLVTPPVLFPVACLVLPLPLAAGLLIPFLAPWRFAGFPALNLKSSRPARGLVSPAVQWASRASRRPARTLARYSPAPWLGWIDLAVAVVLFAATLTIPLGSLAAIFAPLLGFDGVLRSWLRRKAFPLISPWSGLSGQSLPPSAGPVILEIRGPAPEAAAANDGTEPDVAAPAGVLAPSPIPSYPARPGGGRHLAVVIGMTPARRAAALLRGGFTLLAVCEPNLVIAWLAVLAAMAVTLLPTLPRRRNSAVLGFLGAGIALFGLLLLPGAPPVPGYFCVFVGFVTVAAVIPDLAVVLVILVLRLGTQTEWPPGVEALGIGIALAALLSCAVLLMGTGRSYRAAWLQLAQASIAALAICTGHDDGRFAALVLLILLILTRCATRVIDRSVASLAIAGLGGVPPFGVFPGLVLVVLALGNSDPWLLLPVGAAAVPILLSSLPRSLAGFTSRQALTSIGWLPLVLALLVGYAAPEGLVHWWRIMTMGRS